MSNGYDIEFDLNGTQIPSVLKKYGITIPSANDSGNPGALINLFCDEAQLPNSQAATGQINGRYMGEGVINYPHTKLVSDFSLSWMCDANMAPYKFLMAWHNYIFDVSYDGGSSFPNSIDTINSESLKKSKQEAKPRNLNRPVRLHFPNNYQATLKISKTEKGKSAPNSRVPLVYVMEKCYPYSIDAVPLSYGTSQLTRVTANFYYSKHTIYFSDIRKQPG